MTLCMRFGYNVDPSAQKAIVVGLLLGIALALLEKLAPKKILPYLPGGCRIQLH